MSSVISVDLARTGSKASRKEGGSESSRVYRVTFDGDGTPEQSVVADDGGTAIPAYGSALAGLPDRIVTNIDAAPVRGTTKVFIVTVKYVEKVDDGGGGGSVDPDPLSRPPEINWRTNKYQRVIEKDVNGAAIVNSAEDPFDPALTQRISVPAVDITMNVATFDPKVALGLVDSVNDTTGDIAGWDGVAEKGAMLFDARHKSQTENGVAFHRVTYSIEIAGAYLREVLDRGWHRLPSGGETSHYLGGGVFEKVEIVNADGQKPNAPVLLDGSGGTLENGAAPVFLSFETRDAEDWAPLGLPETL